LSTASLSDQRAVLGAAEACERAATRVGVTAEQVVAGGRRARGSWSGAGADEFGRQLAAFEGRCAQGQRDLQRFAGALREASDIARRAAMAAHRAPDQ
jgi:hypothetical protein